MTSYIVDTCTYSCITDETVIIVVRSTYMYTYINFNRNQNTQYETSPTVCDLYMYRVCTTNTLNCKSQSLTVCDLVKQLFHCSAPEWGSPYQHLIQDHSHGPPIHRHAVALTQNHFWSDVVRRAVDLWVVKLLLSSPSIFNHMSRV